MKKFLYTIVLLAVTTASITSCTKEEVKPSTGDNAGGIAKRE